jgi:RimJ/RimL family protein N-acetyltransferase
VEGSAVGFRGSRPRPSLVLAAIRIGSCANFVIGALSDHAWVAGRVSWHVRGGCSVTGASPPAPGCRCSAGASCSPPEASQRRGKSRADGRRSLHHSLVTSVPELRNDGIILNAHNDSEVAAHVAGEDEETACRFGWWPAYSTEETVRAAYANWATNWQEDGPVRAFAARDPGSGAFVGNCELRIGPDGTGEVSYWTHAGKRGRGYARSALALLVGYAASIGVTRLEAHVAPDNHASRHVAEAAGFTQADTFTDVDGTEFIRYARDASGDGAAPFTKLGPDPKWNRRSQDLRGRGRVPRVR